MGYFKYVRTYIFDEEEPKDYTDVMEEEKPTQHDLPILAVDNFDIDRVEVHVEKNPAGDYVYYNYDLVMKVGDKAVSAVRLQEAEIEKLHKALGDILTTQKLERS